MVTHRSPRPWRAAAAAVVAVAFTLLPFSGLRAAAKDPVCAGFTATSPCRLVEPNVNWFWSSNTKMTVIANPPAGSPEQVPGANVPLSLTEGVFGNAAGAGSPISPGHIGVRLVNGAPDMRGYVKFDMGPIPPGSEILSMVMTLDVSRPTQAHAERHQDTDSKVPATTDQNNAKILACAVTEPWAAMKVDGGDPPFATTVRANELDPANPNQGEGVTTQRAEPTSDCGTQVTGKPVDGGAKWRFDLTPIANKWSSGQMFNEGIVLMPEASGPAQSWTVEFHGSSLTVLQTQNVPQPVPLPVAPPETPQERVTYITKAEAAEAHITFAPPPPPETPPVAPPITPPPTFPSFNNPPVAPFPPSTPPITVAPPAPTVPTGATHPTGFWWWMFPIGAIGVGLYSSAVGADAAAGTLAGNRVAGVLHRRRLTAVGLDEAPDAPTTES